MAMAYVFEAATMAQSEYDDLMETMGLGSSDSSFPTGLLSHLAGGTDGGGWRVIDVWESEEAASAFYSSEQFAPVREGAAQAGITNTPWPLHRVETFAQFHELV